MSQRYRRSGLVFFIIFLIIAGTTSSCSILISKTGRYKGIMTHAISKENVRQRLGCPDLTGNLPVDTGWTGAVEYDVFYVHGPAYSQRDEIGSKMWFGMTFGLGEIYAFPASLGEKITGFFVDYSLYFAYYPDGSIRMRDTRRGCMSEKDIR